MLTNSTVVKNKYAVEHWMTNTTSARQVNLLMLLAIHNIACIAWWFRQMLKPLLSQIETSIVSLVLHGRVIWCFILFHIWQNCECFGYISPMRTLCDAYYHKNLNLSSVQSWKHLKTIECECIKRQSYEELPALITHNFYCFPLLYHVNPANQSLDRNMKLPPLQGKAIVSL